MKSKYGRDRSDLDRGRGGGYRHRGADPRSRTWPSRSRTRATSNASRLETYRSQGRGGKGIKASMRRTMTSSSTCSSRSTHDDLLCFTDTGTRVQDQGLRTAQRWGARAREGRSSTTSISSPASGLARTSIDQGLRVGHRTSSPLSPKAGHHQTHARSKSTRNVNRSGLIAVGLKEDDALFNVRLTTGVDDIMLIDVQRAWRSASTSTTTGVGCATHGTHPRQGVKGIELAEGRRDRRHHACPDERRPDEQDPEDVRHTISRCDLDRGLSVLTICENGYGKRTLVDEYRVAPENGPDAEPSHEVGRDAADIKTTARNGQAVVAVGVYDDG